MKRYLIFALALMGIAFFVSPLYAALTLQDSWTTAPAYGTSLCQKREYTTQFTFPETATMTRASIELATAGSVDLQVLIQTTNPLNSDKPSDWIGFGSLTVNDAVGGYHDFDLINKPTLEANRLYTLRIRQMNGATYDVINGCLGGGNTTSLKASGSGTNDYFFSNDYGVTWTDTTQASYNFKAYSGTSGIVKITEPLNEARVGNPIDFRGDCNAGYPISIQFNDVGHPTSTAYEDYTINSIDCTATSSWHYDRLWLTETRWNVRASDATTTDQIIINVDNSYPSNSGAGTTGAATGFSCQIPFLSWDPCDQLGKWANSLANNITSGITATASTTASTIRNAKPYKYAFQLYDATQTGISSPSSTESLEIKVNFQGTTTTLFNASTTPGSVVPKPYWDRIRPYEHYAIYAAFIGFIIYVVTTGL